MRGASQPCYNWTIWPVIPITRMGQRRQFRFQPPQFAKPPIDIGNFIHGYFFDVTAGPVFVFIKRQQLAAIFDGKIKSPRGANKFQLGNIAGVIMAIAGGGVDGRADKPDIGVIAHGFNGEARFRHGLTDFH
jgi:hypothetical protein